jgi:hypothetical protein
MNNPFKSIIFPIFSGSLLLLSSCTNNTNDSYTSVMSNKNINSDGFMNLNIPEVTASQNMKHEYELAFDESAISSSFKALQKYFE